MPRLRLLPDNCVSEVTGGETILQTSLRSGIPHTHACGGHARCSTCRVLILEGLENLPPRNEKEQRIAEMFGFPPEIRLACQTAPRGDLIARRLVLDEADAAIVRDQVREAQAVAVGVEQRLAILFADIRGFTPFAEKLPAYDVIHILNRFFRLMDEAVHRHGGAINSTMGDGFMALFGLDDPREACLRAVRAGLEMLRAMGRLAPYLESICGCSLQIGVGVHVGEVVVGTVGAGRFRRLTAIGDAVNTASRIEASNKEAGTSFLISEAVYQEVKDHVDAVRRCRQVTLKGKSGEFTLWEVVGIPDEEGPGA
jgi:adenylate cyclase